MGEQHRLPHTSSPRTLPAKREQALIDIQNMHLRILRARHYAYTPRAGYANTTQTPLGPTELADTSASGRQFYVASSEVTDPRKPMEMF